MRPSSNQTFSFPRFARLFGRHTTEHLRGYGMTVAVLAGLLLLLMGIQTYANGMMNVPNQVGYYVFFLIMAVAVFTSSIFAPFGEKRQATVALLLPASHLEKYLVAWLYSLPIFLLVFTGVFYLVDAAVLYGGAGPGQTPELLNVFASREAALGVLGVLVLVHGAWLWGAIYFEKSHLVKTSFAVFLLLGVLMAVNFQLLKLLIGGELRPAPPFTKLALMESGTHVYTVGLSDGQLPWLNYLPLGLALLLWAASYFRLREKQL